MRTRRGRAPHVLLIVENISLGRDHRLKKQAYTLLEFGYRVSVICRRDPTNREHPRIRIHEYPAPREGTNKLGFLLEYGYSLLMAAFLTLKVFVTDRFDVLQVSGTPDIYFLIGVPFRWLGRPLVFDQRDLSPEIYESRFHRRGAMYRLLCRLERMSYRSASHVVTVNRSLREIAFRRGGLPAAAVTVVGNGPTVAQSVRRAPRAQLREGKRFLACGLGVMGPQDNVELVLRAIHHLVFVMRRRDCQFALVGDGDARPEMERLAHSLGLGEWVSFPGWVSEDEAFTYLSTADLGLESNLEAFVSPVKGMEYMAFGLPFVAFDLAETVTLAGPAAAYAPPGDSVALAELVDQLLDDPERRAEMGRTARRRFEAWVAWDHQREAYGRVFRGLLAAKGRVPKEISVHL